MKRLFTLIVALFGIFTMYAQFTLDGEIRPRTEFKHGYKAPVVQNTMFNLGTSQRTRIGFGFNAENFSVGFQMQDVRNWGQEKQLVLGDGASTTIHQAWAKIKFNKNLALKVGRQELAYDDHRILGSVGWAQQARSHDIALFQYENKDAFRLHFGFAVNQVQSIEYDVANYKSLQFLWFNKKFGDSYTLSILALNNGVQDTLISGNIGDDVTTYSQIVGQRSVYKAGSLTVGVNFYYQMGFDKGVYFDNSGNANRRKVSAYDLGIDLKLKLNDKLSIGAGLEVLSGNSQTDQTEGYAQTNHAFTPLYGTNHKFNGWMDYFYVGNHVNSVGLNDFYFNTSYKKNKFLAGGTFHYFMTNAEVLNQLYLIETGDVKAWAPALGMEIDTYAGYKLSNEVLLKAGVSLMMDTETMKIIKAVENTDVTNYWGWIMIVVKPTFFKSEK